MELNLLLKENRELKDRLNNRLRRYGLKIMPTYDAEMHGQHFPEMPYVVYIVYVKELKKPKEQYWIVMYPKAIYYIDSPSDWYKTEEENRISITS